MKVTRRQIKRLIKEIRYTTRGPVGGPFAMVWSYFDNGEGWKWKTKSSDEATAFLPTGDGGPDGSLGYYVKIEHKMGTYNMSWTKRTELPGRRVKVIRPQNGWTAGSIPNEIKTAVDEINYDIAQHDAQAEASPGSRPGEHKLDFGKDIGTYNYIEEGAKMKVTKRQLQRIIKEEKAKILAEADLRHPKTGESLMLMLNDVVDKLLDQGMDTYELAAELRGLADDVEDSSPDGLTDDDINAYGNVVR